MTGPVDHSEAGAEAANWVVRLSKPAVDRAVLAEFTEWRRRPGNAEAYARAERTWDGARALADDPDIGAALSAALARPRNLMVRRFAFAGGGLLMLALAIFGLFWAFRPLAYETRIGEQSAIRLEDGTRVRLDTDTRIEVAFEKNTRQVKLVRGQALFDVAHDASRPFRVDAGITEVHALGTEFDVRRNTGSVLVALFQGKVGLGAPGTAPTRTLAPGQRVQMTRDNPGKIELADRAALTGWTEGRLQFDKTPLATAVAEINRYAANPLLLDASALAREQVTGGFDTGDTEAFVEAVTAVYPLKAERDADGRIRLIPRD